MPSSKRAKPKKPYPTFPLTAHPNGQWCKTIRYKQHYFGAWDDPEGALKLYEAQAADLHAGRTPHTISIEDVTLKEVRDAFLEHQSEKLAQNNLKVKTLVDQRKTLKAFVTNLGPLKPISEIRPPDFQAYRNRLAKSQGVDALTRNIRTVRQMFKFAYDSAMIPQPMRFGPGFDVPTRKAKRLERAESVRTHGKRLFAVEQVRKIVTYLDYSQAEEPRHLSKAMLKTCILLGLNGGYYSKDCSELWLSDLDLELGRVDFFRPKWATQRVVTLWPETVAALVEVTTQSRPQPADKSYRPRALLTKNGQPVQKEYVSKDEDGKPESSSVTDYVSKDFHWLLKKLEIYRTNLSFAVLRHTFRTWADEVKDEHASLLIMGHEIPGISGRYIEEIGYDRVQAVTDHVHAKIFG